MLSGKDKNRMIYRVVQDILNGVDMITSKINEAPRAELIEFLQNDNIKIENKEFKITNIPAGLSESSKNEISYAVEVINTLLSPRRHRDEFVDMNIAGLAIAALVEEREKYAKFITPIAAGYSLSCAVNRLSDYTLVKLPGIIERSKKIELPVCYSQDAILEPRLSEIRQMGVTIEARKRRTERVAELEVADARATGAIDAVETRPRAAATEQNKLWTNRTKLPPIGGMNL